MSSLLLADRLIHELQTKVPPKAGRTNNHPCGFSLVELMVVVTIMAILTSFGGIYYGNIQKDQRDQRRLSDLLAVKQAFELYRNSQGFYPLTWNELVSNYIPQIPDDPVSGWNYAYLVTPDDPPCSTAGKDCVGYTLCAKKEGNRTFNLPTWCSTSGSCAGGTGDCTMGLSND